MNLNTYDIDEVLGTKMRALLQRDQSRDLFDLNRALTDPTPLHPPDPDRIVFAFRKYMEAEGSKIDANAFRRNMADKLEMPSFRNDMNQMLRSGTSFSVDAAAKLVTSEHDLDAGTKAAFPRPFSGLFDVSEPLPAQNENSKLAPNFSGGKTGISNRKKGGIPLPRLWHSSSSAPQNVLYRRRMPLEAVHSEGDHDPSLI